MIQPSETPLLASKTSLDMEIVGLQTDIFFIKGVETGTANVKAKLMEEGYETVSPSNILISVIQPFILIPSYPIYVLPHSKF